MPNSQTIDSNNSFAGGVQSDCSGYDPGCNEGHSAPRSDGPGPERVTPDPLDVACETISNRYANASQSSQIKIDRSCAPRQEEAKPVGHSKCFDEAAEKTLPSSLAGQAVEYKREKLPLVTADKVVSSSPSMAFPPLVRLLTVKDVAQYLRCSGSTVWRLAKSDSNFPKPKKFAGSTRWERHEIDAYLDSLEVAEKYCD